MRVVICEDLFLLRDGLTRMLQAHGLQVTTATDTGPGLLAAVRTDQPDVAIVDVRLPPTFTDEGIRAALNARHEVIARLLAGNSGDGALSALSPREREVLALMAEGRSNAVPPAATCRTASTNVPTSLTRSLSR